MADHFEHVGYRYRPPATLIGKPEWSLAPPEDAVDMEKLADRGWQVERLYRRCEDG